MNAAINAKIIQEIVLRNWDLNKFSGSLPNKEGRSDIGVPFLEYENEVEDRARASKCASVFETGYLGLLTEQEKMEIEHQILFLTTINPKSFEISQTLNMHRKSIRDHLALKSSLDKDAALVLKIREDISSCNVLQEMEATKRPFKSNHLQALRAISAEAGFLYFGLPFERKQTGIARLALIGTAKTVPHLLMLLGQLQYLFLKVDEWLRWRDMEGNMQSYDNTVNPFNNDEQLRSLHERISSSSQALIAYRRIVQLGLSNGVLFDQVAETLKRELLMDRPSLDDTFSLKTSVALASTVEEHDQADIFTMRTSVALAATVEEREQAAFQAGVEYHAKKVKVDKLPYMSAQPACHFWDGKSCDYENKTRNTCNYSNAHILGRSTFRYPFEPKKDNNLPVTISAMDYELFLRLKNQSGSSSSDQPQSSYSHM